MNFRKIYNECNQPTERIKSFPEILIECNRIKLQEAIPYSSGLLKISELLNDNKSNFDSRIDQLGHLLFTGGTPKGEQLPSFKNADNQLIQFDQWLDLILNNIENKNSFNTDLFDRRKANVRNKLFALHNNLYGSNYTVT